MIPRLKRIVIGLVVALGVCAAGLWLLVHLLGNREPLYQNKPADYWFAQLSGGDTSASNQAVTVSTTVMIPQLTAAMFNQTEDSKLRLALIDQLNRLLGVHISFAPAELRRVQAAAELGQMGALAAGTIPDLERAFKGQDAPLRAAAALALGHIHSQPETVIPLLMAGLEDPSDSVQAAAAEALGEFGPPAKAAAPRLVALSKKQDKDLRRATRTALRQIDPVAAAEAEAK